MDTDPFVTGLEAGFGSARTSTLKSHGPRVELITRAEPRRRWSVEQRQSIAAESLAPGASPSEVARRHGIGTGLLYTWRKALLAAQPGLTRFARVDVAGSANSASKSTSAPPLLAGPPAQPISLIEIILPNSISVRVDAQIDPRALRRVLCMLARQ
jgi:transposase